MIYGGIAKFGHAVYLYSPIGIYIIRCIYDTVNRYIKNSGRLLNVVSGAMFVTCKFRGK